MIKVKGRKESSKLSSRYSFNSWDGEDCKIDGFNEFDGSEEEVGESEEVDDDEFRVLDSFEKRREKI